MANSKVFSITINGITESISQVDALMAKLNGLEKRLETLSKASASGGGTSSGSGGEDTATKQIKAQNETLKEQKRLQKDIANGAKDVDGEYTNTLNGLRAQLRDMKAELGQMDLGDAGWKEMQANIKALNEDVKKAEQGYGVFSRNVGNYTESIVDAVSELGSTKITLNVGGVEREFDSAREASKELKNEMNALASQMYELEKSGQKGSESYQNLATQFDAAAEAADKLDHITEYADRLKTSIQDDSGAIGELSRAFESFAGIAQTATGIMGLFGKEDEDVTKAINTTVQVMATLEGVQKLINTQFQQGTPLLKGYHKVMQLFGLETKKTATNTQAAAVGQQTLTVAQKAGTIATKAFSTALKSIPLLLVISLITELIANFSEVKKWIEDTTGVSLDFSKVWDKIKSVMAAAGAVILKLVTGPIKTLVGVIQDVISGDFANIPKRIKENYDIIGAASDAYAKQEKKNAEEVTRKKAEELAKQKKATIEANEAKYGSDWKYTTDGKKIYDEYFTNLIKSYKKDSEEYKKAVNEKSKYDYEFEKHTKEQDKKRTDEAKKTADKLKAIEEKIQANNIASLKDGHSKRMANIKAQWTKELAEAKSSGIRVKEQELAINRKYNKLVQDETDAHLKKLRELQNAFYSSKDAQQARIISLLNVISTLDVTNLEDILNGLKSKVEDTISPLGRLENSFKSLKGYFNGDEIKDNLSENLKNTYTNIKRYNTLSVWEEEKRHQKIQETRKQEYKEEQKELVKNLQTQLNIFSNYLQEDEELRKLMGGNGIDELMQSINKYNTMYNAGIIGLEQYVEKVDELLGNSINNINEIFSKKGKITLSESAFFSGLLDLQGNYVKERKTLQDKSKEQEEVDTIEHNSKIRKITQDGFKMLYDTYSNQYNELEDLRNNFYQRIDTGNQSVDFFSDFTQGVAELIKFKDTYEKLGDTISRTISDNEKKIVLLQERLKNITDPYERDKIELEIVDLKKVNKDLSSLQGQVQAFLDSTKWNWQDWSKNIASIGAELTNVWASFYTSFAEMSYNNAMNEIEQEQEKLDEESAMLEKQLDKANELYEEHNNRVNELENELSTARGDRREEVLAQLNNEMAMREKAFQTQQKIQAQQEAIEKRKQQLEKRAEAEEKKRNKANQKIQIAQAIGNTALAVTNALSVNPWFLGVALAALAGSMGAAQIATIASQKYADGGVIQGASHSQGGVKVLGGQAEVEGGEFITNKRTTAKNLPLLNYINSQTGEISIGDLEEFFASSTKTTTRALTRYFANGGQLPTQTANNTPNINVGELVRGIEPREEIWVSVTEIESVQKRMANIRAISGEE